jgi:hypothetical protein
MERKQEEAAVALTLRDWEQMNEVMRHLTWGKHDVGPIWFDLYKRVIERATRQTIFTMNNTQTETKHTQGPWEASKCQHTGKWWVEVRRDSHKTAIAQVLWEPAKEHGGTEQANARLIASAPMLLAALLEASRALTELDPLADHHNAVLIDDALQAANPTQP